MWHEARKQERKIRGMLVDYRRRAERRRDFYEKIKADPTQFMQLHGRSYKIHIDASIAAAAESSTTMMPWQGHADNLIDRFDARAHLDYIPPYSASNASKEELSAEERQCNYERYRVLVQNAFLGIHEEKFLRQLYLEEQFGCTPTELETKKKKPIQTGVAIGFNYDTDPANVAQNISHSSKSAADLVKMPGDADDSDENDDLDFDLSIDVSKIEMTQAHDLNKQGQLFGMRDNDFYSYLTNDLEEAENIRAAREEEEERALFSGRKSRRQRRAHAEKRLLNRNADIAPSYAAKPSADDAQNSSRKSKSTSRSVSPVEEIQFITSFGGDDNEQTPVKVATYAEKLKSGLPLNAKIKSRRLSSSIERRRKRLRRSTRSNSRCRRSRSRSWSYRLNRKARSSSSSSRSSRSRSPSRSAKRHHASERKKSSRSYKRRLSRSPSSTSSFSSRSSDSRANSPVSNLAVPNAKTNLKSKIITPTATAPSVPVVKVEAEENAEKVEKFEKKPIPRYYGRRKDESSSELSGNSSEEDVLKKVIKTEDSKLNNDQNTSGVDMSNKSSSASKLTAKPIASSALKPQERLKRKLQLLINKTHKADKIAEQLRNEKLEQEAREREDQMREMFLKLRKKKRNNSGSTDSDRSDSDSSTSDYSSRRKKVVSRRSSSSRSRSPKLSKYKRQHSKSLTPPPPGVSNFEKDNFDHRRDNRYRSNDRTYRDRENRDSGDDRRYRHNRDERNYRDDYGRSHGSSGDYSRERGDRDREHDRESRGRGRDYEYDRRSYSNRHYGSERRDVREKYTRSNRGGSTCRRNQSPRRRSKSTEKSNAAHKPLVDY